MKWRLASLGRDLLFQIDAEKAHGLSIKALKSGFLPLPPRERDKRLSVKVAGFTVPNPIGMAAGYDKNAEVPNAILKLGFGFAEVGTITPRPQAGNDKPRVFRLVEDRAVINRLGFNNEGHEVALRHLKARARRAGIVGVNIGANKDSEDRAADYVTGIRTFAAVADYFTVNISSPNTPGLRDLQGREPLRALLKAVCGAREAAATLTGKKVPVFLKIAPDLNEQDLDDIAQELLATDIEGAIVSNTTLSRAGLIGHDFVHEAGGLSGQPLFERSTAVLARMRQKLGPEPVLIGVGGVDSTETAWQKIAAGADLVQLYTGFVFHGPLIAREIVAGLKERVEADGVASISDYRDSETESWAARPID